MEGTPTRHRPLPAEQETIVGKTRIADVVLVDDARLNESVPLATISSGSSLCNCRGRTALRGQVDRLPVRTDLIRGLLMVPLMVSGIVVALMSKVLFDAFLGIVNYLIGLAGFGPSAFYGAADTAMASIVPVDVWWQTAFVFIIMLAGLQGLPRELIEAAKVEGASNFAIFWRIKFPLLRPLLLTVLMIRSIDTLEVFDIVFGTTGGGPARATEVLQTLAYRTAYGYLQIGKSMTIMVLFGMLILGICLVYDRIGREDRA